MPFKSFKKNNNILLNDLINEIYYIRYNNYDKYLCVNKIPDTKNNELRTLFLLFL